MKLSIVSTMYRSAPFLEAFCERMLRAAEAVGGEFELVLVNDGSPDDSLQLALELRRRDPRISVVDLSRNFGHHAAIVAGLEAARGERVFLIDSDLEEQPEWLPQFIEALDSAHVDVVFGTQETRVGSFWSNLFGRLFWSVLGNLASVDMPRNPMTCRLMTRRYVNALLEVGDRVLYLASVFAWTGFEQKALALKKQPRPSGHKSTYGLSRKLVQVVDALSSFSAAPLIVVFFLGLAIWIGSILLGAYVVVDKLAHPADVLSGFTSLILSIWFLGGLIILVLGIVGLYLSKVFQEVKRRPLFIVRKTYRDETDE